jgi:hypothetical protein
MDRESVEIARSSRVVLAFCSFVDISTRRHRLGIDSVSVFVEACCIFAPLLRAFCFGSASERRERSSDDGTYTGI